MSYLVKLFFLDRWETTDIQTAVWIVGIISTEGKNRKSCVLISQVVFVAQIAVKGDGYFLFTRKVIIKNSSEDEEDGQ